VRTRSARRSVSRKPHRDRVGRHPLPVSATTAAELATARVDRDDLESVLRLMWPYTAKLYAGIHLSQRRQAARDDAVFNELIARLDEEDDDCDG
jgi:hypothetical protein